MGPGTEAGEEKALFDVLGDDDRQAAWKKPNQLALEWGPTSGMKNFGLWDKKGNKCATAKHIYYVRRPAPLRKELEQELEVDGEGT